MDRRAKPTFFEFFAGGGMAREGLGNDWECRFSNDFDPKKAQTYRANWGKGASDVLRVGDIRDIRPNELPSDVDLFWASFPCQDLSLAGGGAGLKGERSGTFWPFWKIVDELRKLQRAPRFVVLENVCGTLTSHSGADFVAICSALSQSGYRFGAVVIDAALFIPQSRPRLFIVAVRGDQEIPASLAGHESQSPWHTGALLKAYRNLPEVIQENWVWWKLPAPPRRNTKFIDLIEENPADVTWHSTDQTNQIVAMMSDVNRKKVSDAIQSGGRVVGALYKRTRYEKGKKVQRAEVRFDDIAGCLRTPAGGSSRQFVVIVDGGRVRTRLISARETARLMGLPDDYVLPERYNEAYHLTGDGLVVPVVRHISESILLPLAKRNDSDSRWAA